MSELIIESIVQKECWYCGDIRDRHIETYLAAFDDSPCDTETWCCMNCGKETQTFIF